MLGNHPFRLDLNELSPRPGFRRSKSAAPRSGKMRILVPFFTHIPGCMGLFERIFEFFLSLDALQRE